MSITPGEINDIASGMNRYIESQIYYQTFKSNAGLKIFMDDNKEYSPAADGFGWLIQLGLNPNVGNIVATGADVTGNNTFNTLTQAHLEFKTLYYSTPVSLDDYIRGGGESKEQIVNIFNAKGQNTIATVRNLLSQQLYQSGTGQANVKQMNGLEDIFADAALPYAGITPTPGTDREDWLAINQPGGAGGVANINFVELNKMINRLRANSGFYSPENATLPAVEMKPDIILSNHSVQDQFVNTQQGNQVFNDRSDLTAGFQTIMVNDIPWYTDSNSPGTPGQADNHCYVLSKESIRYKYRYGFDRPAPMSQVVLMPNQPIQTEIGYNVGNLYAVRRNVNGRFTGIVA